VHQQDPQLRRRLVGGHAEHAPDPPAVELGDPRRLAVGVVRARVVGDDPRHERFEGRVPPELRGVDLAVRHDDPAEVPGTAELPDRHLRQWLHPRSLKQSFQCQASAVPGAGPPPDETSRSARARALLDAAYGYVLEHGLAELSLRPLAAAIGSSPRVLLFLFGSKDGLVRALLGRARADELDVLERVRQAGGAGGLDAAAEAVWTWLTAAEHRALLTLWLEGYARSLVDPDGAWAGFAAATVHDWLAVLDDVAGDDGDATDRTLLLAVLRGALLDLLATGDVDRVTAAVARHLRGSSQHATSPPPVTRNPRDMTQSVNEAPEPDSQEFLDQMDTVEKVSPDVSADEAPLDAGSISTDPSPNTDPAA
jgi:AcrR family transcriptional regulator